MAEIKVGRRTPNSVKLKVKAYTTGLLSPALFDMTSADRLQSMYRYCTFLV